MGSSLSRPELVLLAIGFGGLFLLFDAARYFVNQLSPMRLRTLITADPNPDHGSRWLQSSPHHFSLVSGVLLQFCLAVAVASTVAVLIPGRTFVTAAVLAALIWCAVALGWKFILVLVPEPVAEVFLKSIIPVSHVFYYVFWPLLFPLRWVLKRVGDRRDEEEDEDEVTDEEVRAYIDVGEEEGILEGGEGRLLQSIVGFGETIAKELMTPRIDIQAFEVSRPLEELSKLFCESKYSRIPVYEQKIDRIAGIVHIKDAFDAHLKAEGQSVAQLARPAYFIPETKKVSELLREFQIEHLQIAIVVDEYGGTAGLITIEDVIEEIVGEIEDEHEDEVDEAIIQLDADSWLVNGLARVETLQDILDVPIDGDDYETVAGLIFTQLGRVPKAGESVTKNGIVFEVDRADRKRIYRVKVTRQISAIEEQSA